MIAALLPCPFCGHEHPEFERMGDRRQSCIVICGNCGARHESGDEGSRNGSSWNQRSEPGQDGLRATLETALARIEDMLADDDGQAFKEARKFLESARQLSEQPVKRCPYCDDTGDVHSIDGEWRGTCNCPAVRPLTASPTAPSTEASEPVGEPLFYYRPVCNGEMYEGPIWAKSVGGQMRMAENPPGSWKPLFGYPPEAQCTTPPEIDYDLLIAACYGRTGQAQGTKGCVQFAKGAEWYRELIATTPPPAPVLLSDAWQPIETAPKDGRTMLLGHFNALGNWRTMRGQWMSAEYIEENWEDPDNGEEGWFETAVEPDDVPNCWATEPTHWQPLPPPPIEQAIGRASRDAS